MSIAGIKNAIDLHEIASLLNVLVSSNSFSGDSVGRSRYMTSSSGENVVLQFLFQPLEHLCNFLSYGIT